MVEGLAMATERAFPSFHTEVRVTLDCAQRSMDLSTRRPLATQLPGFAIRIATIGYVEAILERSMAGATPTSSGK